ncbi:MAG TPA: choice-of-anchor Q domain-containing protein [Bryobacteraceae bacterium]|nr:choice-of-anchor Q domain-containing protein [Bryobacteraceae bacterium]
MSIWGLDFGEVRGTSYVTVNGVQLTAESDYAEWGVTSSARGLQRITFWLKSTCTDGAGTISVTVGGVTSETIPFRVAAGSIYFIAPAGSNSNNGSTASTAWKDLAMFNPGKNPAGDGQYIVYVRAGTYTTEDVDEAFVALRGPYGSDTKRKALVAYPGETPLIDASNAARGVVWNAQYSPYGRNNYFTFAKLRIVGGTEAYALWGDYLRVVGNSMEDMRTSAWTGVVMVDNSQQVSVLGNLFKNCGYDSYKHNIYIKTHPNYVTGDKSADYVTVGWNEFADPYAGSDNRGGAIFISRSSDSGAKYVDHVYIHSNYFHGGNMEFIYTGDNTNHNGDVWIYNNVMRENTNGSGGMFFAWGTRNVYLYNNTFYGLKGEGMMAVTSGSQVISKNNIWYSTGTRPIGIETYQGATVNSENDLFFGAATPSGDGITVSSAKTADPLFASTSDLHLTGSSPARDAGTSAVSNTVTRSYDGVPRPQASVYDIGAFEFDLGQQASVQVAVSPSAVEAEEGQQKQFTATVTGSTNKGVTWSMTPVIGSLSASGLYTAPVAIASRTPVTIAAVSQADSTASGTATATLVPPFAATLSVSPASVSLGQGKTQQFTATASGGDLPALTWTLSPQVGTVVNGLYTAPSTVTASQQVTVKAASTSDSSISASAVVTLVPATTVTLSISPATVSLGQGQTRQFSVTAAGGTLPALTWTLSPQVGTVVNGLYTAPSTVTASQQVTVKAASTVNSSISASAVITLVPATTVTLSISPSSVSLGQGQTRQFSVTAAGGTLPALTWTLSPQVGTVVNGLYTAPSTIATAQRVTVTAASTANSSVRTSAVVTLTPPSAITVTVSPRTATLFPKWSRQFVATVTGTATTKVTWSISPQIGTISATGYYTAPSSITKTQTVTIRATSVADGTRSATAAVTLVRWPLW